MIFIHPQTLISASIISLAFLLASATPIPSPNVVSGADSNAVVTKDPSRSPSVINLFARGNTFSSEQTRPNDGSRNTLSKLLSSMVSHRNGPTSQMQETAWDQTEFVQLKRLTNEMHASHLSEDAMVKTIKKVTTFILPELEDDQVVSADVFYAIAAAKHIVSTFQSKKRGAIKNIEACEAAALAKKLPRYSDFLISDTDILELMKKFEAQPKATNRRSRMFQKLALKDLVQKLAYLPLENQRGISKELEAGYKAAVAKIDKWDSEADIWAKLAKEVLGEWEGLNSLVNVSNNAT